MALVAAGFGQAMPAAAASAPESPAFIKQGQQLMRDGKLEDALALYRAVLKSEPNSVPANTAAGVVLDLMGRGREARLYFAKAIEAAPDAQSKSAGQRAMAMSYAFASDCKQTVEWEQKVLDYAKSKNDFFQQGEVADEAARVCIDSGEFDTALEWYKRGHDLGLMEPGIKPERKDLWEFRWEHAQARVAARKGDRTEAEKHVAAAKAILDRGTNPNQVVFFPYLKGYVELYRGDAKAALADLQQANQNDAFIQCLMAQAYEKVGENAKAVELYQKAASTTSHNPPPAYSVPYAKKRLAALGAGRVVPTAALTIGHIFVVRHAEKVSETADALSEMGTQRAACLAATLKDAKIKTVLTSQFKRTEQTAAPTSQEFHVTTKSLPADAFETIAETARHAFAAGDVLIVGHSNTVPQIVKALSGVDVTVGATDYDQLFVILGPGVLQLHYCPAARPGPESHMK